MRFLFPLGKQQQTGIQFTFASFQLNRSSPVCPELLGLSEISFLTECSKKETSEIVLFTLAQISITPALRIISIFFLFFHHSFPFGPHLSEVLVPDLFKLFWKDRTHSSPGVEWKRETRDRSVLCLRARQFVFSFLKYEKFVQYSLLVLPMFEASNLNWS